MLIELRVVKNLKQWYFGDFIDFFHDTNLTNLSCILGKFTLWSSNYAHNYLDSLIPDSSTTYIWGTIRADGLSVSPAVCRVVSHFTKVLEQLKPPAVCPILTELNQPVEIVSVNLHGFVVARFLYARQRKQDWNSLHTPRFIYRSSLKRLSTFKVFL